MMQECKPNRFKLLFSSFRHPYTSLALFIYAIAGFCPPASFQLSALSCIPYLFLKSRQSILLLSSLPFLSKVNIRPLAVVRSAPRLGSINCSSCLSIVLFTPFCPSKICPFQDSADMVGVDI